MGNFRFRLSDMMPNAWFYKLRDMSKTKGQNPSHPIKKKLPSPSKKPRKSIYQTSPVNPKFFDTRFPFDPPRKSSNKRGNRRTIYVPSPRQIRPPVSGADYDILQEPDIPVWLRPGKVGLQSPDDWPTSSDGHHFLNSPLSESDSLDAPLTAEASWSSSGSCKLSSSATDIVIDVDEASHDTIRINSVAEFNVASEPELPPILTKPRKQNSLEDQSLEFKNSSSAPKEKRVRSRRTTAEAHGSRKSVSRSGGVRIRGSGPKLAGKKIESRGRRSVKGERKKLLYTDSLAIVKASFDPERDFRDSMMEMIVENNIRASKDLEDLLACYLSLNSNQYHDLIIKAFEQIWFNMPRPHS